MAGCMGKVDVNVRRSDLPYICVDSLSPVQSTLFGLQYGGMTHLSRFDDILRIPSVRWKHGESFESPATVNVLLQNDLLRLREAQSI